MQVKVKRGFTMIELSISIAFIALLSIIVVLIITNAVSSYRRGLTLNQINTTGMDLVDNLRAAIQESPARPLKDECKTMYDGDTNLKNKCEDDNGVSFAWAEKRTTVRIKGGSSMGSNIPVYGAFCTGRYSYLWNAGYFFNDDYERPGSPVQLKYKIGTNETVKSISDAKLLRIIDEERMVCKVATGAYKSPREYAGSSTANMPGVIDISSMPIEEDPIDLLAGNNNLAIYGLSTTLPAESKGSNGMFYSMSLILGTVQGGINVKVTGNYCAPPEGYNSAENFDYCAINKFNFAARAMGE